MLQQSSARNVLKRAGVEFSSFLSPFRLKRAASGKTRKKREQEKGGMEIGIMEGKLKKKETS